MPLWMHAHEVKRKHFQLHLWNTKCFLLPLGILHMLPPWTRAVWSHYNLLIMGFTYQSLFWEHSCDGFNLGLHNSRVGKKLSHPPGLFIRKDFFALNILLYFINKILVIFKKSVIYFLHFRPVRMKASMDPTCILNIKYIYFQKPVWQTIKLCKSHSYSYIMCSLFRIKWIHCFTRSSLLAIKSRYLPFIKGFSFHIRNAKIKPPPFSRCIVFSIHRSRGILGTKLSLNTFLKAWNNSTKNDEVLVPPLAFLFEACGHWPAQQRTKELLSCVFGPLITV